MPHTRYTTLSHCWRVPSPSNTHKTIKQNEDSHLQGMVIAELPRTYRDAIAITQALGVRFLWIDSLCIIQDDELDWQVEASKMASVFHGSYLTIAATASNDTEGGCFFDPDDTVLRIELPTIDSYNSTSDTNQSNTFIYERIPFRKGTLV